MSDCFTTSKPTTRRSLTLDQAVDVIGMQLSRSEQIRQLQFMAEMQGEAFAKQVKAKVLAGAGFRKK